MPCGECRWAPLASVLAKAASARRPALAQYVCDESSQVGRQTRRADAALPRSMHMSVSPSLKPRWTHQHGSPPSLGSAGVAVQSVRPWWVVRASAWRRCYLMRLAPPQNRRGCAVQSILRHPLYARAAASCLAAGKSVATIMGYAWHRFGCWRQTCEYMWRVLLL